MLNKRISLLLPAFALVLAASAGGISADQPPSGEVLIRDYKFVPPEITVKAGDTVRWTNMEKRQYHSVWFEQAGDPEAPYIFPGETTQRKFEKVGSFPYHCGPHPEMTGTVHVE